MRATTTAAMLALIALVASASGSAVSAAGCDTSGTHVKCAKAGLTAMPVTFDGSAKVLDLSHNQIAEVVPAEWMLHWKQHRSRRAWTSTCNSEQLDTATYYDEYKA